MATRPSTRTDSLFLTRAFASAPSCCVRSLEIAPEMIDPVTGLTVAELYATL